MVTSGDHVPESMTCPTCKKPVRAPGPNEPMGTFPFCCERCKLIDLGRWLDGRYQIPVAHDDENESDRLPPPPIDDD